MRNQLQRSVLALSLAPLPVALAGCTVGPDYHPPQVEMPSQWLLPPAPAEGAAATRPSVTTATPPDVAEWWTRFDDPTLESLVRRAVESNLDLRQAAARVRQARAGRRVVSARFWPTVDVSAAYRRTRNQNDGGGDISLYTAGLDASWEIDVFGGVRRDVEAATAELRATVEDRRDVQVIVASEVALNYVTLRGLQRQIHIARENLVLQRRSADLTRRQFEAGLVAGLDVANATSLVATTESQVPLLESDARQTVYALSVLLGLEPGALLEELGSSEAPVPATPPEVPIGLPSDLLRRRPDIRRAEAQLHAQTARIGVATADLFPRFSLNGSLGFAGDHYNRLFDWGTRGWSFGPNASWPLFDAGRIRANIAVQNALQEQALLAYRSTVLLALQEVENALVAYSAEQRHRESLRAAVAANRRAVELSTQLYTQGQTDFLNVLSAQRSLFSSEEALVASDVTMAANLIALYRALGGGWEGEGQGTQNAE